MTPSGLQVKVVSAVRPPLWAGLLLTLLLPGSGLTLLGRPWWHLLALLLTLLDWCAAWLLALYVADSDVSPTPLPQAVAVTLMGLSASLLLAAYALLAWSYLWAAKRPPLVLPHGMKGGLIALHLAGLLIIVLLLN